MITPLNPDPSMGPVWAQRIVAFVFLLFAMVGVRLNEHDYDRWVRALARK
jgi:hypothetical protein